MAWQDLKFRLAAASMTAQNFFTFPHTTALLTDGEIITAIAAQAAIH
jgi:hypothetical protein